MDLELVVQVATLVSILAGIIGIFIGIRVYNRQMNAQLFLEYTSRYEKIMQTFPPGCRQARLDIGSPPESSEDIQLAVLRYLNLCSEEFYLWKRGFLAKSIWRIWEKELQRTLTSQLVTREWPELRPEFDSYSEFAAYVDKHMRRGQQAEAKP